MSTPPAPAAAPAATASAAAADPAAVPWLVGTDLDAPLAWRAGQPVTRRQYLVDVQALAERLAADLPGTGPLLALTGDRYRFAVALGAGLLCGRPSLLPPNHTPDLLARLRALFPQLGVLVKPGDAVPADLPTLAFDAPPARPAHRAPQPAHGAPQPEAVASSRPAGTCSPWSGPLPEPLPDLAVPAFHPDTVVAQVLTSGSTGAPLPHAKHWGPLVRNIDAEAERIARQLGRADLRGVQVIGTVPPHHMYGFESTVLIALRGGAAFATERPFFPAEIAAVLAAVPRPRVLVTTPFHLRTLLDAAREGGLALPPVDLVVSATAPLSPQLAQRAEAALAAPLMEVYGCTEAGQVATRRTTDGPEWTLYRGLSLHGDGDAAVVQGGHVPEPTRLADVLEVLDPQRFRLLGRSNDLVNIAGKRSSLAHLDFHLNSLPGVRDGACWLPTAAQVEDVVRLVALVVPVPGADRPALAAQIAAAMRQRVDAAFVPRPILFVDDLPRDPTGKLPAQRLADLASARLARRTGADPARPPAAPPTPTPTPTPTPSVPRLIAPGHPAFAGHFPGQPILPGVVLLAEVLEALLADPAAAARLGSAPRLGAVKFLSPVGPGARLAIAWADAGARLRFEVHATADRPDAVPQLAASGQFEAVVDPMGEGRDGVA